MSVRKILPVFLGILLLVPSIAAAATDNVVISEIQVGGALASDEFVELYNPTLSDVDLTGWRLRVGASTNLVASMSGTIKGLGYLLIANPAYTIIPVTPDFVYSASSSSITANSYISLLRKTGTSSYATEDLVGMGTATSFEGTAVTAPAANKSIERLPVEDDADDNSVDFSLRETPNPQNSAVASPTPTETLTPTPTPTSAPDPTATPTATPSPTPQPTVTPTPTNTPEPSVTPTIEPTITPTPKPHYRRLMVIKHRWEKIVETCRKVFGRHR